MQRSSRVFIIFCDWVARCSCLDRDRDSRCFSIGLSGGNSNGFPLLRFLAMLVMVVRKGDACILTAFPCSSMNSILSSISKEGVSPMLLGGFAFCIAVFEHNRVFARKTSSLKRPVWLACKDTVNCP